LEKALGCKLQPGAFSRLNAAREKIPGEMDLTGRDTELAMYTSIVRVIQEETGEKGRVPPNGPTESWLRSACHKAVGEFRRRGLSETLGRTLSIEDLLQIGQVAILESRTQSEGLAVTVAKRAMGSGVTENRGLKADEERAVGQFISGANELGLVIRELEAAIRRELADESNLVPISPRYF
jgi:hypothetical protein